MKRFRTRLTPTLSSAALLLAAGVVFAASCAQSSNSSGECRDGLSLCDGQCVDTQANADHCGACGDACAEGQGCAEGRCQGGEGGEGGGGEGGGGAGGEGGEGGRGESDGGCDEGETDCAGVCADLESNPRHCGACGEECAEGQICADGECGCGEGLEDCDGACVSLQSDMANCGACGESCSPSQQCVEGACTCSEGLAECGVACANLQTSELHCGACGVACERGAFCQEGACSCVLGTTEEITSSLPLTLTGTTVGGETNYGLACVAAGSSEHVYLFTAPEHGTYTMDTFGSGFDTALGVVGAVDCAQLGCNDDAQGAQSKLRVILTEGQSVLVVVTGFDGAEGEFKLNLGQAGPPICPTTDEVITELPQVITGDTALLGDRFTPTCGDPDGPDASYVFTAPADGKYVFDTFGSGYNTVLELRDGGCDGRVIACNDDSQEGAQSRITTDLTAGQTVVVVVDGASGEAGPFTLNISEWVPPPCPMEDLGSTFPQSVNRNTTGLDHYLEPSCLTGAAPEMSFSFTAPAAGRYTFDTFGSSFDTVLHVHDGSCTGRSLGCNNDATSSQSQVVTPLAEGQTAYVVVDGAFGSSGAFTLNVDGILAPPCPENELGSVVPQTVTGTTAGRGDFVSAACGAPGGAEATYSFTAPNDGVYVFDTFGSSFNTIVHVLDGSCGGASLGCNDNTAGPQSRVAVPLTAGQAVVVVVDGAGTSAAGAYTLNVSLFDGTATCASPIDLGSTVPQTATGPTLTQPNSAAPSCVASSGNDRVYRFTAPADGTYVIDTLSSTFDTVLHVHDGDSCTGAELACNDNASGVTSRVNVTLTAGQVITIVADSRPSSSGNLTLHINAAAP
ncbi:MXAN_6577-like cysteine-rich protein [Sorangium sp. So ce131]|uniref:MXAN_6577-like cysteine-rich protein n=1 Tax=Sorangium sp. So ce131 TaxID=3133282 RepID=UPI003F61F62D